MNPEAAPSNAEILQQELRKIDSELARIRGAEGNRLHQPAPEPASGERPTTEEHIAQLEQRRRDIRTELADADASV